MTITNRDYVERAMKNLRNHGPYPRMRWALVKETFAVGSTTAAELCRQFNLDPDELIKPIDPQVIAE